jgi:hypothetical protein
MHHWTAAARADTGFLSKCRRRTTGIGRRCLSIHAVREPQCIARPSGAPAARPEEVHHSLRWYRPTAGGSRDSDTRIGSVWRDGEFHPPLNHVRDLTARNRYLASALSSSSLSQALASSTRLESHTSTLNLTRAMNQYAYSLWLHRRYSRMVSTPMLTIRRRTLLRMTRLCGLASAMLFGTPWPKVPPAISPASAQYATSCGDLSLRP